LAFSGGFHEKFGEFAKFFWVKFTKKITLDGKNRAGSIPQ